MPIIKIILNNQILMFQHYLKHNFIKVNNIINLVMLIF